MGKVKHIQEQQGSAHVVIIICLVLGLITALGWIFWQNFIFKQSKTEVNVTFDSTKPKGTQELTVEEKYKGKRIMVADGGYSIKVPGGWSLVNPTNTDGYFDGNMLMTGPKNLSTLVYDQAKDPQIMRTEMSGWGGHAPGFWIRLTIGGFEQRTQQGDVVDFNLDDGTKGSRTKSVAPKGSPGAYGGTIDDDFIDYGYKFVKEDKTLTAFVSSWGQDKYDHELFENVIRSIELK